MGAFRLRDFSVASRGRYAMPVVSPLQARVATPPVSMHFAAGFHAVPHKSSQAAPRGIRNVAQANPPHSFSAPFHGYRDQALPDQLASADASFRASQVRLVNFHQARDSFPIQPHHGGAQLVQQQPRRSLAAESQFALQTGRAQPCL